MKTRLAFLTPVLIGIAGAMLLMGVPILAENKINGIPATDPLNVKITGAAHIATSQTALSTSAASIASARSTRRSITIKNTDASIVIYVGVSGVTSGTGYPLKANDSITIYTTAAVYAVAASSTPTAAVIEEYN